MCRVDYKWFRLFVVSQWVSYIILDMVVVPVLNYYCLVMGQLTQHVPQLVHSVEVKIAVNFNFIYDNMLCLAL